nr:NfeD family protein [endosymbiont of Lamellibrachia barhami]
MEWEYQLLAFAAFSIINILIARAILQRRPIKTDQPNLNRRGAQYTGRVFTLDHPIINGEGKIHVDDSTWKIRGADCPAGTQVKVVGDEGVVLRVESVD